MGGYLDNTEAIEGIISRQARAIVASATTTVLSVVDWMASSWST